MARPQHRFRGAARFALAAPLALATVACVQVQLAQDKPIDINLNVNIKQEVVVRLEKDVADLIASNPGVF